MHERLAAVAASQSGVFGMADAQRVGVSTDELTRMSHHSALALHGIGTFGTRDDVVVVETRDVSRTRTHAGLVAVPWSPSSSSSTDC